MSLPADGLINLALPGAREDRAAYARVCGHLIVETSTMLNLAEGVVCMTGFALAMAQKEKVRHLVSDTVFRVRGERGEDLGFKRMDRPLAEQLTPPVQVRVPRLYWEQYECLTETGLTWLHHERRMTFKEFVKLTLLTADRLFAQDARASRFAGRACVNLGLIAAIAPRKA